MKRKPQIILTIEKKWFDMVKSREKREVYLEYNEEYKKILKNILTPNFMRDIVGLGFPSESFKVLFRNESSSDSPSLVAVVKVRYGLGKPEWGAEAGKKYFVLWIMEIEEERRR